MPQIKNILRFVIVNSPNRKNDYSKLPQADMLCNDYVIAYGPVAGIEKNREKFAESCKRALTR